MSTEPQLVAKLFAQGPFVRAGRRAPDSPVVITGQVDAAQGTAYAVAALPVIASGDRWLPAGPDGAPSTIDAVVQLPPFRVDRSLGFEIRAHPSWWTGVDGVLMSVLYDLDLGGGTFYLLLGVHAPTAAVPKPVREALTAWIGQEAAQLRRGLVRLQP